jgi:hypothetical protein
MLFTGNVGVREFAEEVEGSLALAGLRGVRLCLGIR